MKTLKQTSQFKKDLKRIQNNPLKVERLGKVLRMLRNEVTLPAKTRFTLFTTISRDVWNVM